MEMNRLTMAQALVKWMCAQKVETADGVVPVFAGVFGIFGHGNVTCLAEALERVQEDLPTWRGQNEQGMALAGVAYAKAKRAERIMVATSSVGPGATNMVTAAAVAMANRLPLLILSGDTFQNRRPDPVLQQVENFSTPSETVNDCFKPVVRYWDRITHPEQLMNSLPAALQMMLDPATRGPAFLGLPQDTQADACAYPDSFFDEKVWRIPRRRADSGSIKEAARILKTAKKPLMISGGGVLYSRAEEVLNIFAERRGIPVAETTAGKTSVLDSHKHGLGLTGPTGSSAANALAEDADVVLLVGTRLQDFTTGSWSCFQDPNVKFIHINAAAFDAHKHNAVAVVGDAKASLQELDGMLDDWSAPAARMAQAQAAMGEWRDYLAGRRAVTNETPRYSEVVGAIHDLAIPEDRVLTAAGGLPGEMNKGWLAKSHGSYDCEYGFSCMGYETSGGWGAAMAKAEDKDEGELIVFVGDGSYMMMNSDIYSSVLSGHKMIVIVCDNGGYAVINRLQNFKGGESFNNLIQDCRLGDGVEPFMPHFADHAAAMGAEAYDVDTIDELKDAFAKARKATKTVVISTRVQSHDWTGGDSWWDVGVPEVSPRKQVRDAKAEHEDNRAAKQRIDI
ncbi:MAG: 3D-(3,5/4)-trihydroxycyclohexane-1,2-dione acylhydrolase (decyclizing) [Pseudomonadota bacterium]